MAQIPLGIRVALAQLAGCLLLCVGVLLGPVDDLPRALVVGLCAGSTASALAGFRYPGWPWFSAGLACALTGVLRQHLRADDWLLQWLWSSTSLMAFVVIWPVSQAFLIHVFHVETQEYEDPFADSEPSSGARPLRGLACSILSATATMLMLLLLGASSPWMAGPAWYLLAVWLSHAFPALRPEWQLMGILLGLALLAGLGSHPELKSLARPCLLIQDSFWLCGLGVVSTTLGYWCSLWHQRELLLWGRPEPRHLTAPVLPIRIQA